jgi:hypothetical protein
MCSAITRGARNSSRISVPSDPPRRSWRPDRWIPFCVRRYPQRTRDRTLENRDAKRPVTVVTGFLGSGAYSPIHMLIFENTSNAHIRNTTVAGAPALFMS